MAATGAGGTSRPAGQQARGRTRSTSRLWQAPAGGLARRGRRCRNCRVEQQFKGLTGWLRLGRSNRAEDRRDRRDRRTGGQPARFPGDLGSQSPRAGSGQRARSRRRECITRKKHANQPVWQRTSRAIIVNSTAVARAQNSLHRHPQTDSAGSSRRRASRARANGRPPARLAVGDILAQPQGLGRSPAK